MKSLEVDHATVRFGSLLALDDVSLGVGAGQIIGLAGPNGAGKSTLLRVLLGLVRPDRGRLLVDGRPRRIDNSFKEELGYLPEAVAFSDNLTGWQVVRFFASARRVDKARAKAVLERVGLAEAAHRRVRGYSRGMRQRLGLGLAMLSEPTLLILDEPTGGLDQQGLAVLREVLTEQRAAGRMVLLATHDLGLLEPHLDRIALFRQGKLHADDTPARLRERAALPVRVSFGLTAPSAAVGAFIAHLERFTPCSRIERREGEVHAELPAGSLLALLELQGEHAAAIAAVRVREPGMDAVYEHLVGVGV